MPNQIDLKELPHQFLMRKYALTKDVLSNDTKQLVADLEKTIRLVAINSKKKGGNINLTPATQQKISTYDRYICDGIYEHLEDKEKEEDTTELEDDMEEKREVIEDKMEDAHNEAIDEKEKEQDIVSETEPKVDVEDEEVIEFTVEPTEEQIKDIEQDTNETKADTIPKEPENADEEKEETAKIGFWEWQ